MTTVSITPKFVNPPKEGRSFGSLVTEEKVRYEGDWSLIAHCVAGVEYQVVYEAETWPAKGKWPESTHNVIREYVQAPGALPMPEPVTTAIATPLIPPTAPPPVQVTIATERNGARVGMFFNALKELNLAGLHLSDEEILQWYSRALTLSDLCDGVINEHDSN